MEKFEIHVADDALADPERRLRATRWLDESQTGEPGNGIATSFVQRHCAWWLEHFDWRDVEARINRQPNFLVELDGLRLHCIHRQSSRADAIPLMLIHGWPTSFLEFLEICDALAEPEGGGPAFHVVIPSLPGYGFSETRPGTSPRRIATLFADLMSALGHERFIVQGGNWGSSIGTEMARDHPERVIGLHLNSLNGRPPPGEAPTLSSEDQALADVYATLLNAPHFNLLSQTPLTVAHALNDSPAGLLAWVGEKLHDWADTTLPGNPGLSSDWIVATTALYWLTGTSATSANLYREAVLDPAPERYVSVPTGIAHFAHELVIAPRAWAEPHYNIVRWQGYERGGHYPAVEVPELFTDEIRQFAASL
ncbi:MAG: epoxide hydrolase [Novosphingobium sp.]|nr:epoxide hydrolase [Novosphingobium sp.]